MANSAATMMKRGFEFNNEHATDETADVRQCPITFPLAQMI